LEKASTFALPIKKAGLVLKGKRVRFNKNKFGSLKKATTFATPIKKALYRKCGITNGRLRLHNSQMIKCNGGYTVIISSLNIWKQQQHYITVMVRFK